MYKRQVNGLTKRDRGLPIFCPLDEPELFDLGRLRKLDFVYVDAGTKHSFPYTGARWYTAELVQHMLDVKVVEIEHCMAGLEASRHMSPALLAEYFELIKQCWEKSISDREGQDGMFRAQKCCKQAILSMIGL